MFRIRQFPNPELATFFRLHLRTFAELGSLKVRLHLSTLWSVLTSINPEQQLALMVNALAAAGDVLIAVMLCILLRQSRTGFQR